MQSIFTLSFFVFFKTKVSAQRQTALTRLCTGLSTFTAPRRNNDENGGDDQASQEKKPVAVVEGVHYKVVWSCLLLVEMIMTYLASAAYFQQSLATSAVTKVVELLRLFNTRTTNLVLGAGAIHSAARLKSINAKHLSYVTQCLGMIISLLPHVRAALIAQLPQKQHTLLADLDSIKSEFKDHNEKVLNKFVSIIGGIVEHGLAPRIPSVDFDDRAKRQTDDKENPQCFVFLDGIASSTRKLHHVLNALLPPDHLQDVFSRIFAHLDEQIPALFVASASTAAFSFPKTDAGKYRLLLEVAHTTKVLNELAGVLPWDFTARNVLERKLDYKFLDSTATKETSTEESTEEQNESEKEEAKPEEESDDKDAAVTPNGDVAANAPEQTNGDTPNGDTPNGDTEPSRPNGSEEAVESAPEQ